jgi:S1-C subfamily serine protease
VHAAGNLITPSINGVDLKKVRAQMPSGTLKFGFSFETAKDNPPPGIDVSWKRFKVTEPSMPTAMTQPATQPATPKLLPPDDTVRKLGLELGNMSDDLRKRYNIKDTLKGVVITDIHASSPAADQPWRPGNIIIEIADEAVSSVEEFRGKVDRMRKDGQNSALLVVAGADGAQATASEHRRQSRIG